MGVTVCSALSRIVGGLVIGVIFSAAPIRALAAEPVPSSPSSASEPQMQAVIPFANRGGIRDWQVLDDSNLLIEDNHHQWYQATLQGPAIRLAFAEQLGFDTSPSGSLERLSTVVVGGLRYPIISLVRVEAPGKDKKK